MPSKKKLRERSSVMLGDILANPGMMVTPSALASSGLIQSYSGMHDWIENGWLDEPYVLPNGRLYWLGSQIADTLERRTVRAKNPGEAAAKPGHCGHLWPRSADASLPGPGKPLQRDLRRPRRLQDRGGGP